MKIAACRPVPKWADAPPGEGKLVVTQGMKSTGHAGVDLGFAVQAKVAASENICGPHECTFPNSSGIVFVNPTGMPAVSVAVGQITRVGKGSRGEFVEVKHPIPGQDFRTVYRHLKGVTLKKGQAVAAGTVLGAISFDPRDAQKTQGGQRGWNHLHFETRLNGKPVDPVPLLSALPPFQIGGSVPLVEVQNLVAALRKASKVDSRVKDQIPPSGSRRGGGGALWLLIAVMIVWRQRR